MMALLAELLPDSITDALHTAEPLGEVTAQRYPTSAWRRYDKLKRFPGGFAVIGDAVCSFNPVYRQGMTSAAIQAKALRDRLIDAAADNLSQLYFRRAADKIAPMWRANRLNDFAVIPVHDWRSIPQRTSTGRSTRSWPPLSLCTPSRKDGIASRDSDRSGRCSSAEADRRTAPLRTNVPESCCPRKVRLATRG
jgi:2-polyprenyl-6-methoxyphenol hydroxylase-like FAD-dependent oxidoreductase